MRERFDDRALAYALLRLTFGVNFFGHGLVRIIGGVDVFAAGMTKEFEKTVLPLWLVEPFGMVLPFVELMLGVLLIPGLFTRQALVAVALLMTVLTFGSSMQSNWSAVGTQLLYAAVCSLLLFLRQHNALALDARSDHPARRSS